MPKHKLSLDSLQVETFEPVDPGTAAKGTVFGHWTRETNHPCASCARTCNIYDYCTNNDVTCATCNNCPSANCPSANGTCDGAYSCAATCNQCTDGYTCVGSCGAYSCICSAFCNSIDVCETEAAC